MLSLKYVALVALVIQTTSAVILTRYSKLFVPQNVLPYYSTSLVVSAEVTKLIASLWLVFLFDVTPTSSTSCADAPTSETPATKHAALLSSSSPPLPERFRQFTELLYRENFANPAATLKLSIPAALYTLQNNLIYVALSNLEPTTFQVGYQMKVVTTAVFSVLILSRSLSWMKWFSIFLLAFGIVLTQVERGGAGRDSKSSVRSSSQDSDQNFFVGLVAVVVCGCSSALAGVYFEKILKGTPTSVWMRNAQLAFFSVAFGMAGCIFVDRITSVWSFFRGYYYMVWTIVFVQAIGGLIVAVVVKYADNILKGFATAISIIVCGGSSSFLFGWQPTPLFVVGGIVVICATMLYSLPDYKSNDPNGSPVSSPTTSVNSALCTTVPSNAAKNIEEK